MRWRGVAQGRYQNNRKGVLKEGLWNRGVETVVYLRFRKDCNILEASVHTLAATADQDWQFAYRKRQGN